MATTRTASVMFTDVVDSTARAARVGPQDAERLRVAHVELVRRVLRDRGGIEVKTLGDGVMAVFDSVVACVDAAVRVQQDSQWVNRTNPDAPEIRVGVSLGEVTEDGGDVFGPAVVEAARLCSEAAPQQILCAGVVRTLAQAHCSHVFQALGRRILKGLPEPLSVDEVRWEALVEPGLRADFAHLDDATITRAVACLDVQRDLPFFVEVRARVLELLAPRSGERLADVGCGAGHDVLELAGLVGPGGTIVGVDKSSEMIDEARSRAAALGVTNVDLRVGGAEQLPLDDDSVDGAWSDRVLQYVADPRRAMTELLRVTRPGGRVVVADTDWGASVFDCDDAELSRRIDDAWTTTRANGRIGRRLFALMVRAGFEDVRVFPHTAAVTDVGDSSDSPRLASLYRDGIIPSLAAQAVDAGAVTSEEASRWVAMQLAAVREGRFLRFLAMFVVAGRVPR